MPIQPYLFFEGRAEEAIDFYREALGAEVEMLLRFKDNPEPSPECRMPPGIEDKVMHATLRVGDATVLVSDGGCEEKADFSGFSLSLTVADAAEAEKRFAALGEGGTVRMPLGRTFFSPAFGMVADRFGVSWMVYVAPDAPHAGA